MGIQNGDWCVVFFQKTKRALNKTHFNFTECIPSRSPLRLSKNLFKVKISWFRDLGLVDWKKNFKIECCSIDRFLLRKLVKAPCAMWFKSPKKTALFTTESFSQWIFKLNNRELLKLEIKTFKSFEPNTLVNYESCNAVDSSTKSYAHYRVLGLSK